MTSFPISGNAFDTQAPDARRTMADDFRAQADKDRAGLIGYFCQRIVEEQHKKIVAVFQSTLDDAADRIARYRKIIKTLEGE
jgi:hypothetical protein